MQKKLYLNILFVILGFVIMTAFIVGFIITTKWLVDLISFMPSSESKKNEVEQELSVSHEQKWGIYVLDLQSEKVELIFSDSKKIDSLSLSNSGDKFAFSQPTDGEEENREICIMSIDGSDLQQITSNQFADYYPIWSLDDSQIVFLSHRKGTMDIYTINVDGSNEQLLYDSGYHDADINWVNDKITFTRNSQIWIMNNDGSGANQVTDHPKAGQWGNANLPFGDYDPRLSPDGTMIIFARLVDDSSEHGNYDIYKIRTDGTDESRLTNTGYSQGIAQWSHNGDKIIFIVGAIDDEGKYDIYIMNADGSDNRNITPDYFPSNFLCHSPQFSNDDTEIYFVGEWY